MPINHIKQHHLRQHHKYEVSKPGPDQIRKLTADATTQTEEVIDHQGNIIITDSPEDFHPMLINPKPTHTDGDSQTTQTGKWYDDSDPTW